MLKNCSNGQSDSTLLKSKNWFKVAALAEAVGLLCFKFKLTEVETFLRFFLNLKP